MSERRQIGKIRQGRLLSRGSQVRVLPGLFCFNAIWTVSTWKCCEGTKLHLRFYLHGHSCDSPDHANPYKSSHSDAFRSPALCLMDRSPRIQYFALFAFRSKWCDYKVMPRMHRVESTSIAAIGYVRRTRELYVRFLETGRTYVYQDVEASVFESFWRASSKGNYFNREIKGEYSYFQL